MFFLDFLLLPVYLQKPIILPFLLVVTPTWSCFHNYCIIAYYIYFGTFLMWLLPALIFWALPSSFHFGSVRYSLFICTGLLAHQLDFLHKRIAVDLGDCHSDFKFLNFIVDTAKDTLSLHIPNHYFFICEKEMLYGLFKFHPSSKVMLMLQDGHFLWKRNNESWKHQKHHEWSSHFIHLTPCTD